MDDAPGDGAEGRAAEVVGADGGHQRAPRAPGQAVEHREGDHHPVGGGHREQQERGGVADHAARGDQPLGAPVARPAAAEWPTIWDTVSSATTVAAWASE